MSLMRWEPFRELATMREAMERMFVETWRNGLLWSPLQAIPMDVMEDGNGYTVKAELPGVRPEDVSVTANGSTITIQGEFGDQPTPVDASKNGDAKAPRHEYRLRERRSGRFYRSITLPPDAQVDRAEATFEHGVLTLAIPKAEEARPKQIPIRNQPRALEGGVQTHS